MEPNDLQTTPEKSNFPVPVTPTTVGTAAAALGGLGLYKYMRRPLANAIAPGQRFARTTHWDKPKSAFGQWLKKQLYGVDDLIYMPESGYYPARPKKFKGHVFYEKPEDIALAQGTSSSGGILKKYLREVTAIGDNKWKEYQFFQRHVPGTMPTTHNLADVLKALKINKIPNDTAGRQAVLKKLQAHARKVSGGRFYIKDVGGIQSKGYFPTEKHDLADLYGQFRQSDIPKIMKNMPDVGEGKAWERQWRVVRERPEFPGHVLEQMFKNPKNVILQRRIPVRQTVPLEMNPEMRVHVVGGRVDPGLATYRYNPALRHTHRQHLDEAAGWVQKEVVDKLPPEYKGMNFAMDVLPSSGKHRFQIVESNPSGESGFLHPGTDPISAHRLRRLITGQYSRGAAGTVAATGAAGIGGTAALGTYLAQRPPKPEAALPEPNAPVQPPVMPAAPVAPGLPVS